MNVPSQARARASRARGLTYVWTLIAIALLGVGLGAAGRQWATVAQREREAELIFAGNQIREAIGRYYESTPGAVKLFPPTLEDLLRDPRYPGTRRYLRRVYQDPFARGEPWELLPGPGGGIIGVRSRSQMRPLRQAFGPPNEEFTGRSTHASWEFVYVPGRTPVGGVPAGGGPTAATGSPPARPEVGLVPALPGTVSPSAALPPSAPPRNEREETCRDQALADRASCVQINRTQGFKAGQTCLASIGPRMRDCMAGATLPPIAP